MKIITFYQFDTCTNPRFPPFLLYVRCKFRVTFVRRCFRYGPGYEGDEQFCRFNSRYYNSRNIVVDLVTREDREGK